MTEAEIRTAVRNIINEQSTDAGALLGSTNTIIDDYINDALEDVVLDLMPYMQSQFMKTKAITLVADQANYSLAETYTASTIAFVNSSSTITDSASGFVTAGFEAGMTIQASGTTHNDNTNFSIVSVAAGTLTLSSAPTDESAGTEFTLTQQDPYWMLYKVEVAVSDRSPREIEIIDPLQMQYHTLVGETEAKPNACYFRGNTLYFVKTPSTATTGYATAYLIRPESFDMGTYGPVLLPRPAHRMVVYKAAELIAISFGVSQLPYERLYERKKGRVLRVWEARY